MSGKSLCNCDQRLPVIMKNNLNSNRKRGLDDGMPEVSCYIVCIASELGFSPDKHIQSGENGGGVREVL